VGTFSRIDVLFNNAATAYFDWLEDITDDVEIAKGLISQTQNSLAEIALLAGFSDQSKLCRTFASVVGAPPGKWKRENSGRKGSLEMFEEDLGQASD
jgi:AraC-like DNA-binding protein